MVELKLQVADLKFSLEASNKNLANSGEEIERLLSRSLQLQRELSDTKIRLREEQDRLVSTTKDRDKAEGELKVRTTHCQQMVGWGLGAVHQIRLPRAPCIKARES